MPRSTHGFIAAPVILAAPVIVVTFALVVFGADSKDADALQGIWLPSTAELAGKEFPEEVRKSMKLEISGDNYKVTVGPSVDKGSVKLNPSSKPKALDIIGTEGPNKGKTFLAIYELDGDTLQVCYDLGGKARPSEFKTKAETQLFLVTYKREKR